MSRIKALIVDDERLARRAVRGLLERDPDIEVVGEAADGEPALALITALRPELVFLDVHMPNLSGLEMLGRLGAEARPEFVFVTAYDQHAVAAFDANAVDYVLKPFSDSRFAAALERAKGRVRGGASADVEKVVRLLLSQLKAAEAGAAPLRAPAPANASEDERLVVKANGELHFILQADLRWVEAQGDFVKLHLKEKTLFVRMTMARIEKALSAARFARIHRSTIVNMRCIRRVVPLMARNLGAKLDDGTVLTISDNFRSVVKRLS
jgi:two-component system, LytTR family, response regulator